MSEEDQIKILIPSDLKKRFQRWCLDNDVSMSRVLRSDIEDHCEGHSAASFLRALAKGQRPPNSEVVKLAEILEVDTEDLMKVRNCLFDEKDRQPNGN
jgi:hypothetical protein